MDSYVSNSDTFLAGTIFLYTNSSIGIMTLKEKGKKKYRDYVMHGLY